MGLAVTPLPPRTPASLDGEAMARLRGRLGAAFGRVGRKDVSAMDRLVAGLAGVDRPGGEKAADALRRGFKPWARLAGAQVELVAQALRPVEPDLGRALARAERLVAGVRRLLARTGGLDLEFLAHKPAEEALAWLQEVLAISRPLGVAVLTASPLRHRLAHVPEAGVRTLDRLMGSALAGGWAASLQDAAPAEWTGEDIGELCALLQALGEAVCLPTLPDCGGCPLVQECVSGKKAKLEQNRNTTPSSGGFLRRRISRMEGAGASPSGGGLRINGEAFEAAILPQGLTPGVHQAAPLGAGHAAAPFILVAATVLAARLAAQGSGARGRGAMTVSPLQLLVVQEIDALTEHGEAFTPGFQGLGLSPQSVAFVRVGSAAEVLRVVDEALKLKAAQVIAAELRRGAQWADLAASRRLGLSARRAGAWLWLITPDLSNTSAALTRWRVGSAPSAPKGRRRLGAPAFSLELTRNRQGPTGAWTLEWDVHDHRFRTPRTSARPAEPSRFGPVPAPALPAAFDRPDVAETAGRAAA